MRPGGLYACGLIGSAVEKAIASGCLPGIELAEAKRRQGLSSMLEAIPKR